MNPIEIVLRNGLQLLVSSSSITERKRNVENLVELIKEKRTQEFLDHQNVDETSINWNEMFNVIRESMINDLATIRTKSSKIVTSDAKYQEALKLFKAIVENGNTRSPQIASRPLIESIVSILTSDIWSTFAVVLKELSHLFIHHLLTFHRYLNDLLEQEWIDLCRLYMSLSSFTEKSIRESDQTLYSSYLRILIENFVVYEDLNLKKTSIGKDLLDFLRIEFDQLKNSNHFSVIENLLVMLNCWTFKYVLDMPEEMFQLGNDLLPFLTEIWRRKCHEKAKTEIIKFARLQMILHQFESDESWTKNLRDLNDLIVREIEEICHKQRSTNRLTSNEFQIRSDLISLASDVFFHLSSNDENLFEPTVKRIRLDPPTSLGQSQLKSLRNFFQSNDFHHQAAGFQIVSFQVQRRMKICPNDAEFYFLVLKRFLAEERRPWLLVNALRCVEVFLRCSTLNFVLSSDFISLIEPLIHHQQCQSTVIEILFHTDWNLSTLCSIDALEKIFHYLIVRCHRQYSLEDENRLFDKFLPDLFDLYRKNENDLSTFFTSISPETTKIIATILMQLSSFDVLPHRFDSPNHSTMKTEFDQLEIDWRRLKHFPPINEENLDEFVEKKNFCQLNKKIFQRFLEIFSKNVRFLQQLKDRHAGERMKLILHWSFLGVHSLEILQNFFLEFDQIEVFKENLRLLFAELTEETSIFKAKTGEILCLDELFEHVELSFSSPRWLKSICPSIRRLASIFPSLIEAKFLSDLYKVFVDSPRNEIEGIRCPLDVPTSSKAFRILLRLAFQATFDQLFTSNSTLDLLTRLLEEKLYVFLDELSFPDPNSFRFVEDFFSEFFSSSLIFNVRLIDLEFVSTFFLQLFRSYRRDFRLCRRLMFFLRLFVDRLDPKIRREISSKTFWSNLKKLIGVFWQIFLEGNSSRLRRSIVELKQIDEENLSFDQLEILLDDSSFFVRCRAIEFSLDLFYEISPDQSMEISSIDDERRSLAFSFSSQKFSFDRRLKSRKDQEEIWRNLMQKNSSSIDLLSRLAEQSEFLSLQVAFRFLQMFNEGNLSDELFQRLCPSVSLEFLLRLSFPIENFPWKFFPSASPAEFSSLIYSMNFFARRQISPEKKRSFIEHFAEIQSNLLPLIVSETKDKKFLDEFREIIEEILPKVEYQRLIKQKLTPIIFHLLLKFSNDDEENFFYDQWKIEPIGAAFSWKILRKTFEYLQQLSNAKHLSEFLIKSTDLGEILFGLSKKLFSTSSRHDQLRLFNVFVLFLTEILSNPPDHEILHSVFRDSIYIVLRFVDRFASRTSLKSFENELDEKIRQLICDVLYELCSKGLKFDLEMFSPHLPDLMTILLDHSTSLGKDRLKKIFQEIYRFIRDEKNSICVFVNFVIEKIFLGGKIRSVTSNDFLVFLAHRRSKLPARWILEMFDEHLENHLENSSSKFVSIVKEKFLRCLKSKNHRKFAGKCLAKFSPFLTEENEDEDQFEAIPTWIIDDLIFIYLIDDDEKIVELTRTTLKMIFQNPNGQELFRQHEENRSLDLYVKPFLTNSNLSKSSSIDSTFDSDPWRISTEISFHCWFVSLLNFLFEEVSREKNPKSHPFLSIFFQLKDLVQLKIDLGIKLFPYLISSLLFFNSSNLTKNFSFLLEQLLNQSNEEFFPIAQLLFRTINFLRQCPVENFNKRTTTPTAIKKIFDFPLDIDFFQLAQCAAKYRCFPSALIYVDFWATKKRSILAVTNVFQSDLDLFSSPDLIDLFVRIHSTRNQCEEFYGLEKSFETRRNLCGEFSQLTNRHNDALFYFDQSIDQIDRSKIIQSLRFCGLNHLLEQYLTHLSSFSNEIFFRIELQSFLTGHQHLTQWTPIESIRENLFSLIKRPTNISSMISFVDENLWSNVSNLRQSSLINVMNELILNIDNSHRLFQLWNRSIDFEENLFDHNDELFLTRLAATQKLPVDSEVKTKLFAHLTQQLCQNAFDCDKFQLCDRYLTDFSSLIDRRFLPELSFLRAQLLVRRQQDTAGEFLRQLISSPLPNDVEIRCRLLFCHWLSETRSETSSTLKEQLDSISKSIEKLDKTSLPLIFEAFLAMAQFSDNEYQRLNQLFQSPIFENKRLLIARNRIEFEKQEKLDPAGRYTKVLKRSLDLDQNEIDEQKKLQSKYLISTLQNYLTCLKSFSSLSKKQRTNSMKINRSVPEIMITSKSLSYWLTNSNNEGVNETLKTFLTNLPTHFFLPFVYQMAARMALIKEKTSSIFHSILLEFLCKCLMDHPHHVLPVIFALANAHKDAHITTNPSTTTTKKTSSATGLIQLNHEMGQDARSRAANYLIEQCFKVKPQLIDQMRKLNDAYIEAAYWDSPTGKTDPIFSKQLRLMHIKDFHQVAIPTVTIAVAPDGVYRNIETVKNFQPEYSMVGGVNAPKKLLCFSSNGRKLPQLLKGKDDLRQDAVMQQLFNVVNQLLEKDPLTSHRSLQIRTYKVVPLTQKSGVLEWCEGTITFGDYLTKVPDGAHSRYHPDDWSAMDCRRHIHKATNTGDDERKKAFLQTCAKLRPVFRYFFYEHFQQPSLWHRKKQNYAKSVATSSIVGYIVGLGDRHVQNILIDTQTAEVIHIDLGVAFDQGKMLPIPEKIPFRLTRDVIDGLGICGTEGLFKKSCEITLELMRRYADTLITIIEVFLYDPLYQWQLSPQKALQLQQQLDKNNQDSVASSGKTTFLPTQSIVVLETTNTDTNKMAERLLLGLRQKLQGVERFNQMTIKAHVNMLIQEATSIENLSQLFAGWQAYL